jgi:hypothetical protein
MKLLRAFAFATALGASGFIAGWMVCCSGTPPSIHRIDRVVAFQWGDGKYGKAFYGAHVYLEPVSGGYSVRAAVHIGGYDYLDDLGEIGKAATQTEAREKWGTIEFRPDGLHIGGYFLPRERMEDHR